MPSVKKAANITLLNLGASSYKIGSVLNRFCLYTLWNDMKKASVQPIKTQLHSRNRHRNGYDFTALIQTLPELSAWVTRNQYGNLSIDFANPIAVKMLNKALLLCFYQLTYWDIPDNYLCPPIPGRADYIHYLADLLAEDHKGKIPQGKSIRVLDIGVGANAIYPIVARSEYGWSFVGSDINPTAVKVATLIAESNTSLKGALQCRLQKNSEAIFKEIIKPKEYYALTLCNPPFYRSLDEAQASSSKKVKNLTKTALDSEPEPTRNFGGQHAELWCKGGESEFISKMIEESKDFKNQCLWFSSLVSKKETLAILTKKLKDVAAVEVKVISMAQGQKISRFVAWTFLPSEDRQQLMSKLGIK